MALSEEFVGKVVLITGSSSGIGATTALSFARLGAKVVVTGRDENKLEEVAQHCHQLSPHKYAVVKFVGDLGEDQTVDKIIELITEKYNRLDVLVNNAGRGVHWSEQSQIRAFDDVHKVNLRSVYYMCLKALPLLEQSKGVIVNNSSIMSLKPYADHLAYCVSKAGLDMMTNCLAMEWGPKGIRVNSVNPGQIRTPIFGRNLNLDESHLELMWKAVREKYPLRREGNTEDVANAIIFLASKNSSFITGVQLRVDGGFLGSATLALPDGYA